MSNLLINYALYQIGWLACVLGAAWGRPWEGVAIGSSTLAIHFVLAEDRVAQFRIVIAAVGVGLTVDCLLLWASVFAFPHGMVVAWLPPPWMTLLWAQFATTFRYCLTWMQRRYLVGALFGLFGAPAAFWVGERLGAVEFLEPRLWHYAALAFLWWVAVPLQLYLAQRIAEGAQTPRYVWPRRTTGASE